MTFHLLVSVSEDEEKKGEAFHGQIVWAAVGIEFGCLFFYLVIRAKLVSGILVLSKEALIIAVREGGKNGFYQSIDEGHVFGIIVDIVKVVGEGILEVAGEGALEEPREAVALGLAIPCTMRHMTGNPGAIVLLVVLTGIPKQWKYSLWRTLSVPHAESAVPILSLLQLAEICRDNAFQILTWK